jgi:hypothetical protein
MQKELGLSENEINDLIQNKKMANGGEINNYSDKVKFLINKYGFKCSTIRKAH